MPPKSKAEDASDAAKSAATSKPIATASTVVPPATVAPDGNATTEQPVGAGLQVTNAAGTADVTLPATPVGAGVQEAAAADRVQDDAANAAEPNDGDGPCVVVVGPARGRRRIGRSFGREPVRIPAHELSDDQIKSLMSDPTLAVSIFELR